MLIQPKSAKNYDKGVAIVIILLLLPLHYFLGYIQPLSQSLHYPLHWGAQTVLDHGLLEVPEAVQYRVIIL